MHRIKKHYPSLLITDISINSRRYIIMNIINKITSLLILLANTTFLNIIALSRYNIDLPSIMKIYIRNPIYKGEFS